MKKADTFDGGLDSVKQVLLKCVSGIFTTTNRKQEDFSSRSAIDCSEFPCISVSIDDESGHFLETDSPELLVRPDAWRDENRFVIMGGKIDGVDFIHKRIFFIADRLVVKHERILLATFEL